MEDFDDDDYYSDEADDPYRSPLLARLEERLELPQGTYLGLKLEPSDWVFIGKLGLIVEAALTTFLVLDLNRPDTYEHISTISQAQRLKLARTLGLLSKDDHATLQLLASIRNAFVHNLANFSKPLDDHFSGLNANRRRDITVALLGMDEVKAKEKRGEDGGLLFPHSLKLLLQRKVVFPLITMSGRHDEQAIARERSEYSARMNAHFAGQYRIPIEWIQNAPPFEPGKFTVFDVDDETALPTLPPGSLDWTK